MWQSIKLIGRHDRTLLKAKCSNAFSTVCVYETSFLSDNSGVLKRERINSKEVTQKRNKSRDIEEETEVNALVFGKAVRCHQFQTQLDMSTANSLHFQHAFSHKIDQKRTIFYPLFFGERGIFSILHI